VSEIDQCVRHYNHCARTTRGWWERNWRFLKTSLTTPCKQHQYNSVKSRPIFLSRQAEYHKRILAYAFSINAKISRYQLDIGLLDICWQCSTWKCSR